MPEPAPNPSASRALVTGGTSGIGAAFADELAARGTDLVLVARDEARLAEQAERLHRRFGIDVEVLPADLADRDQVERVAARLRQDDRAVDLLVNNAGFGVHSRICVDDFTPHDRAIEVMVRAVVVLAGTAGRAMAARAERGEPAGRIINVGSTAGYVTMGVYSAVKSFVGVFTEGLANELAGTGVGVTLLMPGWVRTEFHARAGINAGRIPEPLWLEAGPLVRQALDDSEAGRVISIPSVRYRVLMAAARLAPRPAIRAVSAKLSSSRRPH
ncbi:hypothetical protein FHX74_001374 [Friedmanniella endophytica]|uniref:Short-chain dehydrogenase n=1 Tax=Microlunatus kandeliicorticis TaxID=1759536 RepID=A0A7W3P5A4_9ACTN|nr:SDR family NAD(P)-dependent oxidoreductase [Microlunatus kandeliicorticis]MBA8793769.1 hypothetical protein [Microlunatus kandeliicorticis]